MARQVLLRLGKDTSLFHTTELLPQNSQYLVAFNENHYVVIAETHFEIPFVFKTVAQAPTIIIICIVNSLL